MNGKKIDIIIYIKKLNTYNNILRYIYISIFIYSIIWIYEWFLDLDKATYNSLWSNLSHS